MATRIDDRWLWVGVGVTAFFAIKGIQYALQDIVRLTEIDPYQYEPKTRDEDHPEDTLTPADLAILSSSPHPNIAAAATSLILSRFARSPHATQMLTKDLASQDSSTRQRAATAVHFLRNYEDVPFNARGTLPVSPPGYVSPTHWSDGMRTPSDDGFIRPLRRLRSDWVDDEGVVVPSVEDPVAGWQNVPRERERTMSGDGEDGEADDAEARRRRREAMVLHEGEGAVTGRDIIRPRATR